jgi:hypothetical protein
MKQGKNGAGERNRTSDLRVTSALLYQLSYSSKSGSDYRGRYPAPQSFIKKQATHRYPEVAQGSSWHLKSLFQ